VITNHLTHNLNVDRWSLLNPNSYRSAMCLLR
jgi:hypothetical protein